MQERMRAGGGKLPEYRGGATGNRNEQHTTQMPAAPPLGELES